MPTRIVVSFRGLIEAADGGLERYLARAIATKKRAEALGATMCAWSAQTFSFDLDPDSLEEAVALADFGREAATLASRLGAGVAQGEMATVAEGGSLAMLSWGKPLVDAVALARDARPGEVLIGPRVATDRKAELEALGYEVIPDRERRVWMLRRFDRESVVDPDAILPIERRPTFPPPPATTGSTRPPRNEHADQIVELARRALVAGDLPSLESLLPQLKDTGLHDELVERMAGFVALQRGAKAEALRRLRQAAEADATPAQRARARLAYGVALAASGRGEAALLEVLDALARAREAGDQPGEHACARFLARLSSASGHSKAAATWARAAARSRVDAG